MAEQKLDELITRWDYENNSNTPEDSTLAARLEILMLCTLAEGQLVSAAIGLFITIN